MTRIAWLPVAWLLACASPPAPTLPPASTAPAEPLPRARISSTAVMTPTPPESKAAPVAHRKQDIESAACAKRSGADRAPCHAVEWLSGGTDSEGRELVVVKVALFDGPGVGDAAEQRQAGACDHYEYWLVPVAEGRIGEPRLLLGLCNDGYGASGVGEDRVEVTENTFRHAQSGGSAWRWSEIVSVSLSPLGPRSLETNGFWSLGAHFHATRFDWDAFRGREAWYTPYCKADGSVDPDLPNTDDLSIGGDLESPPEYAYAFDVLPAVTLDPKFVEAPELVELGTCALTLDAGKTTGFLLEGSAGEPSDGSLSVVANADGTRVYIAVGDDVSTVRPQREFDHLELWSSERELSRSGAHCIAPPKAQVSAFYIDMAGRVDRKRGQGRAPKVSLAKDAAGLQRFVFSWQKAPERLTLVYADSDDGTAMERRFATSRLRPDNADSLGKLRLIQTGEATCKVQGGRLEPVLTLSYVPRVP